MYQFKKNAEKAIETEDNLNTLYVSVQAIIDFTSIQFFTFKYIICISSR